MADAPTLVKCPHCGGDVDVDGVEPTSGDWYICMLCERLSTVSIGDEKQLALRKVSRSDLAEASPQAQRAVIEATAVMQRMKRGPLS